MLLTSDRTLREVARELEISDTALRKWKEAFLGETDGHPRRDVMPTPREMAEVITQLRKKLTHVTWQSDFLKKVASILSMRSQSGV